MILNNTEYKTYKIDCDWCTEGNKTDTKGDSNNSWSGTICVNKYGHAVGVVKDKTNKTKESTHFVFGTYSADVGINLNKINVVNTGYDPIGFCAFTFDNRNSYIGSFSALTLLGSCYHLGFCKILIEEVKLNKQAEEKLNSLIENANEISKRATYRNEDGLLASGYAHDEIIAQLKEIQENAIATEEYKSSPYYVEPKKL